MAFLLNKTTIASHLRSQSHKGEDLLSLSRRQYHIEPGPREKALLAEDAALKPFKSYKQSVKQLKKIGNILTIVVATGCCYEIYVKASMRQAAQKQ
ncbi:Succinate dehydrogenase subunit 7B, mitochondrial [Stylosanthes scabra]|uniref:Succinate dehydrogenase subunit 7B, mitochondrial n=1 Tax=Stylosanthes scabra TaxID=79078 RepID=A0ABU6Z538_9FABA|nr:Succinate dehydrogenase subunit 7B, mitochondrial [Stylosanthes scabra]